MRLHQTYLMVPSLTESRTFHEDALGLEAARVGETSVEYETGEARLKIQEVFDAETLAEFGMQPPAPADESGDGVVVVLETDDLDDAAERAREAFHDGVSGEMLVEPRPVPWGDRIALVRSPAGYVYELR